MLIVGEVHTGLLRGRDPVGAGLARDLVDLVAGEPVLVSERPRSCVRSPDKPFGVDCPLGAPAPARQVRGIGTALQRATITDGHVVQGSAYATLTRAEGSARRPWSHYLTRPGVIEAVGRTRWDELAAAFADPHRRAEALDLGGVAAQAADRVQRNNRADGRSRLRAARTKFRWVAEKSDKEPQIGFGVYGDDLRILRFTTPGDTTPNEKTRGETTRGETTRGETTRGETTSGETSAARLAAFAEDVALHDWLLTVLLEVVRKAAIGVLDREEALQRLLPAIDYLLHLWLPGARGDEHTDRLWALLERRAGFTRQWDLVVNRIRDQLSVGAVAALSTAIRR